MMKRKICVIDNYDSFVYNLVHIIEGLDAGEIVVYKNDEIDFEELRHCDKILLSPGPGVPRESGQLMEVIHQFHQTHSILGVCLEHQAIGEFFGWQLTQLSHPLHDIPTEVSVIADSPLFHQIPKNFLIGHYHSWVITPPENAINHLLEVTAVNQHNHVMSIKHKHLPIYGVQFHPESIMTEFGREMLANWVNS